MADSFLNGIDVSHFNNSIDWAAVAADPSGPAFAYAKASDGIAMADPTYPVNHAGIKANRMLAGATHFYRPEHSALEQAAWFIGIVGSVGGDLPPMLDIETAAAGVTPQDYAAGVRQWLTEVGTRLNCTPIIYTRASFWKANVGDFSAFAGYPLWIAEYTSAATPVLPEGAATYALWQHSDTGTIAGIAHPVDLDRFQGTPEQLQALVCGG